MLLRISDFGLTEAMRSSSLTMSAGGVPRDAPSSLEGVAALRDFTCEIPSVASGPADFRQDRCFLPQGEGMNTDCRFFCRRHKDSAPSIPAFGVAGLTF
jgi:hypothetical protein